MFDSMMTGHWRLPDSKWVFLLCTAVTLIVCDSRPDRSAFCELRLADTHDVNGSSHMFRSACLSLVRWCHRVCPPALVAQARDAVAKHAAERIDPLALASGCERLPWARTGEGDRPAEIRQLNNTIRDKIFVYCAHAGQEPCKETPLQMPFSLQELGCGVACLPGSGRMMHSTAGRT